MSIVDSESNWFMDIYGSSANGYLGKKSRNANTMAAELFDIQTGPPVVNEDGLNIAKLDALEETEKKN
jgi:hypothetical protein